VTISEDVIKIDCHFTGGNEVYKDGVHKSLESGRGVSQSEQHHSRFEQAVVSGKHGLPFVPSLNANVVIPPTYVELSEESSLMETVNDVES
jgi:hypothetical protein